MPTEAEPRATNEPRLATALAGPVSLALLFDLLFLWPLLPAGPGPASPLDVERLRVLPLLLAQLPGPDLERAVLVALHAATVAVVCRVVWLSAGSRAAALFAASLWAVSPEHARALASGEGRSVLPGALLACGSLALALAPRPRLGSSALLYALALLSHPGALPVPLVVALARGRLPRAQGLVLAGFVMARALLTPASQAPAAAPPDLARQVLEGLVGGFDGVLPIAPPVAVGLLALAAAAALAPGPVKLRVSIWCGALVAFALPFGVLLGDEATPRPGASLLATLPLVALAAEVFRAWRSSPLPRLVHATGEALVVAAFAIAGLARMLP